MLIATEWSLDADLGEMFEKDVCFEVNSFRKDVGGRPEEIRGCRIEINGKLNGRLLTFYQNALKTQLAGGHQSSNVYLPYHQH